MKIPNSLKGIINNKILDEASKKFNSLPVENTNINKQEIKKDESKDKEDDEIQNEEIKDDEEMNIKADEDNNDEELNYDEVINNEEEVMTIIKSVDIEILNIADKQYLNKDNLFIVVYDNNESSELFSSQGSPFSEVINKLPYLMNFNAYLSKKNSELNMTIYLKQQTGDNDEEIGKIDIVLDASQNYYQKSDKYCMPITKKNFKKGKSEILLFLKFTVQTLEDSNNEGGNNEYNEGDNI